MDELLQEQFLINTDCFLKNNRIYLRGELCVYGLEQNRRIKRMKKKILAAMLAGAMVLSMAGCSGSADSSSENAGSSEDASSGDSSTDGEAEETEIQVFIAASLNTVMNV